jgi:hypothetical protein
MRARAGEYGLEAEFMEAKEKLIEEPKQQELPFDPIRQAMEAGPKDEGEIRKIGELVINKAKLEGKNPVEVLKEYRSFGTDRTHTWAKYSGVAAKERLEKAYQYYPTEWLEKSMADSRQNPLPLKNAGRGKYQHRPAVMSLGDRQFCEVHELAHRMEHTVPGLWSREKEFYGRRTAGEPLQSLKTLTGRNYRANEKARLGNFNDPYMGKDNGGGGYEIFSMGIEKIMFGAYNTKEDLDFDSFILGLLLGV